jgi:cytoskeletal protein RodZ
MAEEDDSVLGLATIRRNRGISLEQISASTKISVRSLKAIETGVFQKLPGGIYNTSYIKQYAKAIDFDEAELLAYYKAQMGAASVAARKEPAPDRGGAVGGGFRQASMTG